MVEPRAGASGPFVLKQTAQRVGWDGQAVVTLEALPAGHARGNYSLTATMSVLAAPGLGIVTRVASWSDGGAAQLFTDPAIGNFNATGPQFNDPIVLHSDGTAAIVAEFQPGGVAPGALADLSVSVLQQSRG